MDMEIEKWRLQHFSCFARNGRWGTCGDCPEGHGQFYPEFCVNTDRYDHKLTLKTLVEQHKIREKGQS